MPSKAKPWQVVVLALGGVAAVGSVAYYALFPGDSVQLADNVTLVDVNTGELFSFDVSGGRTLVIPEVNPRTQKRNLLGAEKTVEGKWALTRRAMGQISAVEEPPAAVVDRKTGELRVASETVSRGRS